MKEINFMIWKKNRRRNFSSFPAFLAFWFYYLIFFFSRKPETSEYSGIPAEGVATLERLRRTQQADHLRGSVSGSVAANDRLMKELRDIYRSEHFKKGKDQNLPIFTLTIINSMISSRCLQCRINQRQFVRVVHPAEKVRNFCDFWFSFFFYSPF